MSAKGHKRDISQRLADVCFTPKSGHCRASVECPLCANSGHDGANLRCPLFHGHSSAAQPRRHGIRLHTDGEHHRSPRSSSAPPGRRPRALPASLDPPRDRFGDRGREKFNFARRPLPPRTIFSADFPVQNFFRLPRAWCRCAATNRALPLATGRAKLRNDLGADQRFGRGCVFCGDRSFHDAQDAPRLRL
jgi:hypothetical protein